MTDSSKECVYQRVWLRSRLSRGWWWCVGGVAALCLSGAVTTVWCLGPADSPSVYFIHTCRYKVNPAKQWQDFLCTREVDCKSAESQTPIIVACEEVYLFYLRCPKEYQCFKIVHINIRLFQIHLGINVRELCFAECLPRAWDITIGWLQTPFVSSS